VHMVGQKMPFLNPTLLLLGKLSEHLAQMPAQISVPHFATALRYKTTWYLHSHFKWLTLSYSSIRDSPRSVLGGSPLGVSLDGLPQMSNRYCHTGKAGGTRVLLG